MAVKWDESEFRKRREQHGKAVDIVAMRTVNDGRHVFMIEIKDYPAHPLARVPEPSALVVICADKARDTLAQLLHSPPLVGRPSERDVEELARAFGSTECPLNVIVWVEDANEPPLEITELQIELNRAFRWLPTRSVAAAGTSELNYLDGVSAARIHG